MHGVTSLLGGLSLSSRPALPAPLSVRLARCAAAPRPAFVVFAAASDSAPSGPEPEATAALRSLKGSAFKVRRVLDVIRGRDYEDTLMILEFLPQRCSEHVRAAHCARGQPYAAALLAPRPRLTGRRCPSTSSRFRASSCPAPPTRRTT